MTSINNPFVIKGKIPEAYFCDRDAETALLTTHLINGRNVLLTAARRVGKTALIEHCLDANQWQSNYYLFSIDILQTSSLQEFTYLFGQKIFETLKPRSRQMLDLFVQTVRSITGEFGYDVQTGLPKFSLSLGAIRNPENTLAEIFSYINHSDKRCIIAIDEFQQIVHYPEKNVEAILRTHIQHCENAEFIFAGSERHILTEMFNLPSRPFYASTTAMNLDAIPMGIYSEFVQTHFLEFGKNVESDCISNIYALFDGNTYCMQKLFNVAFAMTEVGGMCGMETVEAALADILLENERNFCNRLSMLTKKPKELLFAIAREGKAVKLTSGDFIRRHNLSSASSVQSAVNQLLENDWITYSVNAKGEKQFTLTDAFLSKWIQRNYF